MLEETTGWPRSGLPTDPRPCRVRRLLQLGPVSFCVGGQLLATLVPRCVDPELTIRPIAFDAVHTVLK